MGHMTIPEEIQEGAYKLHALPEEQAQQLLVALRDSKPTIGRDTFIDQVAPQVEDIARKDVADIIRSLLSFYGYRRTFNRTLDRLVEDITTSDDLGIPPDMLGAFLNRLTPFLDNIPAISITEKAVDLLYSRERLLMNARIIADARPIFDEANLISPVAAMLTQTLELTYIDNSDRKRKEISFAIDMSDIAELRKALDRAEEKAQGIRKMIQGSGVSLLEENYED